MLLVGTIGRYRKRLRVDVVGGYVCVCFYGCATNVHVPVRICFMAKCGCSNRVKLKNSNLLNTLQQITRFHIS